jgi:hypothetical protein
MKQSHELYFFLEDILYLFILSFMCADGFHKKVTLCYGEYWHDIGHFAFCCYVSIGFCGKPVFFGLSLVKNPVFTSKTHLAWWLYVYWPSGDIKIVNPGLAQRHKKW